MHFTQGAGKMGVVAQVELIQRLARWPTNQRSETRMKICGSAHGHAANRRMQEAAMADLPMKGA
jgi:hypothetical protein